MRKDITQAKLGYKRYLQLMKCLNISKNKNWEDLNLNEGHK